MPISLRETLQAIARSAVRFVQSRQTSIVLPPRTRSELSTIPKTDFRPLQRILLTDEVSRTLFKEYAAHRASERGDEEIGWLLLGRRLPTEAIVSATIPAGSRRDAGPTHVRFDSMTQVFAGRLVRQDHKYLTMLGVLHTHPGSLRHPSEGDLRGDRVWVANLRGGEGIFGIGTADGKPGAIAEIDQRPQEHMQSLGELRFSWYALAAGANRYRPVPIELRIGPDVAKPWRAVWPIIEEHAARLERLTRQQARIRFDILPEPNGAELLVTIPLAEPQTILQVIVGVKRVEYLFYRGEEAAAIDLNETRVDCGVYQILAELTNDPPSEESSSPIDTERTG